MNNKLLYLIVFLISATDVSAQWLDGFNYRKQISIQESQIPDGSDFKDFPVLISISFDADLKDEANGGYVNNSSGWDLVFTASNGTTLLDHDIEHYDGTSGEFVAWVKIPTLDHDNNTVIYLYFGDDTPLTDPTKATTWSNGFVSVYHLHDDILDASGSNNGMNFGSVNANGRIADAQDFENDNSTDRIEIGNFDVFNDSITISAWIRPESFDNYEARIVSKATSSAEQDHYWMLATISDGTELRFRLRTGDNTVTHFSGTGVLSTGSWQYVAAVYNGSTIDLFYNGSQVGTPLVKTGSINTNSSADVAIGNQPASVSDWATQKKSFDGIIDEVRIISAARSADWLAVEYNNLSNPNSFYVVSAIEDNIPVASAGPDQDLCGTYLAVLAGNEPSIGVGTWTQISGPGTMSFGNININNTSSLADAYGSYVLRWTIVNGASSSQDEVVINYAEASLAGSDQDPCGGLATTLEGNAPTIGVGTWTQISGPGTITFGDIHENNTSTTADMCGNYILRWTIDNGNSCSTSDDVNINYDAVDPEIICPDGQTAVCDISEKPAYADYAAFVAAGGSSSDNCGINTASFTLESELSDGLSDPETIIRTYTIADLCGNTATCIQTITISDNEAPEIICPDVTTEYLDDNCEFVLPDYTTIASVIDNCAPGSAITQSPPPGTLMNGSGTVQEIELLALDQVGNESSCRFSITLMDNTPPEVISLNDTSVMVQEGIFKTSIDLPLPQFTDNCGLLSVTNDFNGGTDASGIFPYGRTNVTYTVTDINDNSALFNQQVVVGLENEPEYGLVIPEAFSPNEDGLNDRFEILGLEQYPGSELRVYNAHGIEVYISSNYDNSWDGRSTKGLGDDSKLPTGTYYYILSLNPGNSLLKGFIYLRRE